MVVTYLGIGVVVTALVTASLAVDDHDRRATPQYRPDPPVGIRSKVAFAGVSVLGWPILVGLILVTWLAEGLAFIRTRSGTRGAERAPP